jgi:hypothetical protein
MARTIHLAVFSNGTKPAHWAIWIPTTGEEKVGKVLHVTGNPATGYFLEFKRDYNFDTETRRYRIIALAQVHDQCVTDTPGTEVVDTTARDRLESAATVVTPPGRSANPFDAGVRRCSSDMKFTTANTLYRLSIARTGYSISFKG